MTDEERKAFQIRLGDFLLNEIKTLPRGDADREKADLLNFFGDSLAAVMATYTVGFRNAELAHKLTGLQVLDSVVQKAFDGVAAMLIKGGKK